MGKRNGLLRFWGALALCLCLCTGALAESLQGYTVAEKLIKQLDAGSGFSGTLEGPTGPTRPFPSSGTTSTPGKTARPWSSSGWIFG